MARRRQGALSRIISSQRLDMSVAQARSTKAQVAELWDAAAKARATAEERQRWHDIDLQPGEAPTMPDKAPQDLKKIKETAATPFGRMIVREAARLMFVEDFRRRGEDKSAPAYEVWQRNGMGGKQIPLHIAGLTHGLAYAQILPAVGRLDGQRTALIRPTSARRSTAFFRDDFDEWPEFFLDVDEIVNSDGTSEQVVTFIDEGYVHRLSCPKNDPTKLQYIDNSPHEMGLCPVQRYGYIDLDGNAEGEISPYITLLKRIDQDTTDRLVIQRFGAWVVRTIAGMKEVKGNTPEAEAAREALETWLSVGDFLSSESKDTSFGHIPATPMDGHLRARDGDIRDLASASSTPAYRLLGLSDNIGAEAIEAADRSHERKGHELKTVYGEQHEGSMRLAGHAMGNTEIAQDFTAKTQWAVLPAGSLQSLAQGLGTMVTQLGVDPRITWRYLPNFGRHETELAEKYLKDQEETARADALLALAAGGGDDGGDGTDAPSGGAPGAAGAAR